MASVRAGAGATIQLAPYESLRFDLAVEIDLPKDITPDHIKGVQDSVFDDLCIHILDVTGQDLKARIGLSKPQGG